MATQRTQNRAIVAKIADAKPADELKATYEALAYQTFDNCDLTKIPNLGGYEWDTISAPESFCNDAGSLNFDDKGDRKAIATDMEAFYTELTAGTIAAMAIIEAAEASSTKVITFALDLTDNGAVIGTIYQQFKVTSWKPDNSSAKENRKIAFDLLPASVHKVY